MPDAGTPAVLEQLHVSLPDIAEVARVRRPVVSTWRRRYADGPLPFPDPVGEEKNGSQRFRAIDVADWIDATGRGNNTQFRADIAVRAGLAVADPERARRLRDGLAGMLCLAQHAERPLADLSHGELLDHADELDPEDAFLFREIHDLGDDAMQIAELADIAADAAYTPGRAAEAMLADRFRSRRSTLTASALAPAALYLAARIADQICGTAHRVADPFPGCGDLLYAVLSDADRLDLPTALVPAGHRDTRRRLAAHGWDVGTLTTDGEVARPPADALLVTQLPPTGTPEQSDLVVLEQIEELVLDLHPDQRAVVVGPASALVDALDGPAESVRSAVLRSDRLRAAVVLPPGLIIDRSRQRIAVWVLGAPPAGVPIAERWTMVADLSEHRVDDIVDRSVVEDLLTDVEASLGGPAAVGAHAFRFARFVRMAELLARGGGLVAAARPVVGGVRDDGGTLAVRVAELTAALDGATRPALDVHVERGQAAAVRRVPVWALAAEKRLRRLPGNRLDEAVVVRAPERDASLSRVVGVPELTGQEAWGSRAIDTFRFADEYPSGRLTEPGDVVFTTTPYPAAAVDHEGFSAVEYPARVLRVTTPPARADGARPAAVVVPAVLARDIAAQPAGARQWRSWEVRLVPAEQAEDVARTLRAADARAAAARRELENLDALAEALCDGVTAGVVRMRLDETTHL